MDLVQILNIFTSKIGSIFLPSFEKMMASKIKLCSIYPSFKIVGSAKHAKFGEKWSNFIS